MQLIRRLGAVAFLLLAPLHAARSQDLIADALKRGRDAFDNLNYKLADSNAQSVIKLGDLLSKEQRLAAMQLAIAAAYPEESGAQKSTEIVADMIKAYLAAGGKTLPRELTWSGLDVLFNMVSRKNMPAMVLFSTNQPGAVIFVNDISQGPITGLRWIAVPPGAPARIQIRAEKCLPWDTTLTVTGADSIRIGRRYPKCSM